MNILDECMYNRKCSVTSILVHFHTSLTFLWGKKQRGTTRNYLCLHFRNFAEDDTCSLILLTVLCHLSKLFSPAHGSLLSGMVNMIFIFQGSWQSALNIQLNNALNIQLIKFFFYKYVTALEETSTLSQNFSQLHVSSSLHTKKNKGKLCARQAYI